MYTELDYNMATSKINNSICNPCLQFMALVAYYPLAYWGGGQGALPPPPPLNLVEV